MTTVLAIWRFLGVRGAIAAGLALALAFVMWRADSLSEGLERAKEQIAAMEAASEAARVMQQAVNDAAEQRYQQLAERADDEHETTRIVVRDATDRFIRDNGVRPDGQCVASGTPAPAASAGASVPVEVPATVVMDTGDVRACGDLYSYALEAHRWAVELAGE